MNPPSRQDVQPGHESRMHPEPEFIRPGYRGSAKLMDKVAIITGGDSGIGRSAAVHFAREGADVLVCYLNEHEDARRTQWLVEKERRHCELFAGDLGDPANCEKAVRLCLERFGKLDILVNNAGEQHPQPGLEEIPPEQLEKTFRTNFFAFVHLTRAALPHLKQGASIINTTSVTAYKGSADLIDYSATKGAIVAFTRSLSQSLVGKRIRVNGVAPGPIWTPLIPASFDEKKIEEFGKNYPMGRPGQPSEIGPSYVFLASEDSSYMSGQVLHPNGGMIVAG